MKTLLSQLILWLAVSFSVNAQPSKYFPNSNESSQNTCYVNAEFDRVHRENAEFKAHLVDQNEQGVHVRIYRMKSNTLLCTGIYESEDLTTRNGLFVFYYPNGKIESSGRYKDDIKVGEWKRYTIDGTEKPSLYYTDERFSMLTSLATN
jgi:antitoxin component YwqK of YwqJK toxin-antitoxin module